MKAMKQWRQNSGQAVLIIVLVMAVALTVGLAVVSRSVTDIRISRQDEESARAFSAAEAGIEEQVAKGLSIGSEAGSSVGNVNYRVSATAFGAGRKFIFPKQVKVGDTQYIWLVGHNQAGEMDDTSSSNYNADSLEVIWGNPAVTADAQKTPALEATLLYKDDGQFKMQRWALDPLAERLFLNGFDGNIGTNSEAFDITGQPRVTPKYRQMISFPAISGASEHYYLLGLKLLYSDDQDHWLAVMGESGANLPPQGVCYQASASVPSGITRAIYQCRGYKTPGPFFDYALFSDLDLATL